MPGSYDHLYEKDDQKHYSVVPTSGETAYTYSSTLPTSDTASAPSTPPVPEPPSTASPSNYYTTTLPTSPAQSSGYSAPPGPSSNTATGSSTHDSLDDEIDAMLAGGGRITSKMMRQLERKASGGSGSKLPQWPPPKPETTDEKRQKIMSRIKKTKTTDSEGGDLSFAARDDAPLAGKKLVSHYEGEDKSVAWRANLERFAKARNLDPADPATRAQFEKLRNSDVFTTRYDTSPIDRETSRLKEHRGGTVEATHHKRQYNTSDEHGWVMSPETGSIHTFDPSLLEETGGKRKASHHSSPLAGGNVAGAGLMTIKDEHITEITDESGHYRPEGEYTYQAVKAMADRGLLDRKATRDDRDEHESGRGNLSARVSLAGYVENDPRQQKGWLKDEEGIYKDKLTLPYQAFLQTRGNERQARAKASMHEELLGKVPKAKAASKGQGKARLDGRGASALGSGRSQTPFETTAGYIDSLPGVTGGSTTTPAETTGGYIDSLPGVTGGSTTTPAEPTAGYLDTLPGVTGGSSDTSVLDSDAGLGGFASTYSTPPAFDTYDSSLDSSLDSIDFDEDSHNGIETLPGYANVDKDGNVFTLF